MSLCRPFPFFLARAADAWKTVHNTKYEAIWRPKEMGLKPKMQRAEFHTAGWHLCLLRVWPQPGLPCLSDRHAFIHLCFEMMALLWYNLWACSHWHLVRWFSPSDYTHITHINGKTARSHLNTKESCRMIHMRYNVSQNTQTQNQFPVSVTIAAAMEIPRKI